MTAELTIDDAQRDLRHAFVGGGPGLVISGCFWLSAGLVANARGIGPGFVVLFLTGMLIFPLSALACRFAFGRSSAAAGNPMARIALESTISMIAGLVIAWLVLPLRPDWVFPIAALAVGTHFFAFRTAYGDIGFWLLGAILTALGATELFGMTSFGANLACLVAATEVVFGLYFVRRARRAA
jgi:hypothetical protein